MVAYCEGAALDGSPFRDRTNRLGARHGGDHFAHVLAAGWPWNPA